MSGLRRRPTNHGGGNPEADKENKAGEAIRHTASFSLGDRAQQPQRECRGSPPASGFSSAT